MIYEQFLASKTHADDQHGFSPKSLPDWLKDFQRHLTEWTIRKGRAALLCDCGLGKGPIQLVWSQNMLQHTNKPALIFAPLAVSNQFLKEGVKFGIEVNNLRTSKLKKGVNVINYEQIDKLNPNDLGSVSCDESGILKNADGKTRRKVTDFLHKVKYRLLATATPSPNDYMELGTSSEALGAMSRNSMLGMFFTNSGETTQQWELKGHARKRFWRWVCSWARALRKPSDLGFSDEGFILPPLTVNQHVVDADVPCNGQFPFARVARTLDEQRAERRATMKERCEKVAELAPKDDYYLVYCHLNPEGELLEKLIPDSVNVQGSDSDERKEEMLSAFAMGQIKCLISKPRLAGYGLNMQHCNRIACFPSFSWEQYYQLVRRCWRFGQKRPVGVDMVTTQGESRVVHAMQRKEKQMETMFSELVLSMNEYQLPNKKEGPKKEMILPKWLKSSGILVG